MTNRDTARRLAADAAESDRPLEWFEQLYSEAAGDSGQIPWADMTANPNLTEWLSQQEIIRTDSKALVVGCGLGDDAEALNALGMRVTAFDISSTCIEWCRRRFTNSSVCYQTADLFDSPAAWHQAFDFVLESYTLQALPPKLFEPAVDRIADFVAPGGRLLVICRGRNAEDEPGKMPWPLTREQMDRFTERGLRLIQFDDYVEAEDPPVRRFRAEYRRTVATEGLS